MCETVFYIVKPTFESVGNEIHAKNFLTCSTKLSQQVITSWGLVITWNGVAADWIRLQTISLLSELFTMSIPLPNFAKLEHKYKFRSIFRHY